MYRLSFKIFYSLADRTSTASMYIDTSISLCEEIWERWIEESESSCSREFEFLCQLESRPERGSSDEMEKLYDISGVGLFAFGYLELILTFGFMNYWVEVVLF